MSERPEVRRQADAAEAAPLREYGPDRRVYITNPDGSKTYTGEVLIGGRRAGKETARRSMLPFWLEITSLAEAEDPIEEISRSLSRVRDAIRWGKTEGPVLSSKNTVIGYWAAQAPAKED